MLVTSGTAAGRNIADPNKLIKSGIPMTNPPETKDEIVLETI